MSRKASLKDRYTDLLHKSLPTKKHLPRPPDKPMMSQWRKIQDLSKDLPQPSSLLPLHPPLKRKCHHPNLFKSTIQPSTALLLHPLLPNTKLKKARKGTSLLPLRQRRKANLPLPLKFLQVEWFLNPIASQ